MVNVLKIFVILMLLLPVTAAQDWIGTSGSSTQIWLDIDQYLEWRAEQAKIEEARQAAWDKLFMQPISMETHMRDPGPHNPIYAVNVDKAVAGFTDNMTLPTL